MRSVGFGLERLAWLALRWPRTAVAAFLLVLAIAGFGATRLSFDEDLRNTFASNSGTYNLYVTATSEFVDPENETIVLVEGEHLGDPATFQKLRDFQFELQVTDGIDSVYSLFALRAMPDAGGDAPPLVADPSLGLTPDLIDRIRAHPLLGSKLVSADGKAMAFIVTPSEAKAPVSVARALKATIESVAAKVIADPAVTVTVSGFPAVRTAIVDSLRHDQLVLNGAGAIVGFIMSLIVFRSLTAAVIIAVPSVIAALSVVGFMGLFNVPVTVMSTIIPALVMIFGYTDGMHLCFAWRKHRDAGKSVAEAEMLAQQEVAGACLLAAVTTSIAFLSLVISQVVIVRNFGWIGTFGCVGGALLVLVVHGIVTRAIGRFWTGGSGAGGNFLTRIERPSAAVGRFAVTFARPICWLSLALFLVLGALHYSVPPQHSIREHLPENNPANAALGRMDAKFGGLFPVEVVVPLHGADPNSPEALARIGKIHEAVAAVAGVSAPLSLWSVVEWLGGGADAGTGARLQSFESALGAETVRRFYSDSGTALITANIRELPSHETEVLVDAIEKAAQAAGGPDVQVTGVTVVNAREGARTIRNLNLSLMLSVVANLAVIAVAFASIPIGILSFLPNILPLVATGAYLFFSGRGMQLTSVIALTVAFGIAVDGTVHYLNRYLLLEDDRQPLDRRLIATSGHVGPALFATTLIIVAGLSTTLTSSIPTVALFGWIAALTLAVALLGDLVVLPALMAGFARGWFEKKAPAGAPRTEAVDV